MAWTDDLTIRVRPGRSLDELVDRILDVADAVRVTPGFLAAIADEFALPFEHARLALDRAQGGRVRASTGVAGNRPDPAKDPVADRAWQRDSGARLATSAPSADDARWPGLATAFAATSSAAMREQVEAIAAGQGGDDDDRRAAALWVDALAGRPAPADPIDAAVVERVVGLAAATSELADAAPRRQALLRRAAAVTARAAAAVRERRGDEGHAIDGSPLWFDAIALAEASRALAGLFADGGDGELAHDALGLHCMVVTGLLGHCHERVASAMVAFARHAASRGDRATALEACRDLAADLAEVLVARCEAVGGPPEVEDLLALARLDDALALEVELDGDSLAITDLRTRAQRLAGGAGNQELDRRLTADDATVGLAALLTLHQIATTTDGEWLRLPRGCRARARFLDLDGGGLQLDVVFEPWVGTPVIESFAGFGPSREAQRTDAWRTFTLGSLHVLLAAFLYLEEADVERTVWEIDGTIRAVTLGAVVGRGRPSAIESIEQITRAIVESSTLPPGTHWIRLFLAHRGAEVLAAEVLLDNDSWDYGEEQLAAATWPAAEAAPGSVRVFLVVQGGADVSRAIADLALAGEHDDAALRSALEARGVEPLDAALLVGLIPIAFGRVALAGAGLTLSPTAALVSAAGKPRGTLALEGHPIFDEAAWLAGRGTLSREQFLAVATRSPELAGLAELEAKGADPTARPFGPPPVVVP